MRSRYFVAFGASCLLPLTASSFAQTGFVNWENAHVHPVALTPDGARLLAVNTADNRLEVFDVSSGVPVWEASVPVGLDPVSVRARTDTEAWVVNHISDSVSVVDLHTMNVIATIDTEDEPADVVFAGTPPVAFVSCSQANTVLVFDPADVNAPIAEIAIPAEDPRALAVSPDGATVYVAIFESGNGTTILGGGAADGTLGFPPNVVDDPVGPYGGVNPPPNDGAGFTPPKNPSNPAAPRVGLIVRKDADGAWMDDNNGDWTDLVSGANASHSGRQPGWDLPDRDVVIIDAATRAITGYANRLMNICMTMAVNPVTGRVLVVGTEATNEIRYEPNLNGRFLRVNAAWFDAASPGSPTIADLNPHLDYAASTAPQPTRDLSLGDPRGVAWDPTGVKSFVTGMGSNNVIVVDSAGNRAGAAQTIEVGEGPTGVVVDALRGVLYVLNRFEASISVVNTNTEAETHRVPLFDPTPTAIKTGRKHQYDTHKNSGLGHIACGSCHVDSRIDRLAWDLGDPAGTMRPFNQNCNLGASGLLGLPNCTPWHPMKGPMTTQTLQDIIGKEPLHWRGDRNGIEEFNGAFIGLMGDDTNLTPQEMQEYEDFLATITFPPNPFRNFDNTLPTNLPLPGHYTTGDFSPAGQPLPNGNAQAALTNYRTGLLDANALNCVTCHTLPVGVGSNLRLQGFTFTNFPTGPNGEKHHALTTGDGSTQLSIKIPQLRNLYEKVGFNTTQLSNVSGFGYLHDGSVDSLERFLSEPVFTTESDQEVADLVAFMLSFAGSNLPMGGTTNFLELVGPTGRDTHAAVGAQVTVDTTNRTDPGVISLLASMTSLANAPAKVGVVAKGLQGGIARGYVYVGGGNFETDRAGELISLTELRLAADTGSEITFTVVPLGTQLRIGVDRDADGFRDRDELDGCSDPADPNSTPVGVIVDGDVDGNGRIDLSDYAALYGCLAGPDAAVDQGCACTVDIDRDADVDLADVLDQMISFTGP